MEYFIVQAYIIWMIYWHYFVYIKINISIFISLSLYIYIYTHRCIWICICLKEPLNRWKSTIQKLEKGWSKAQAWYLKLSMWDKGEIQEGVFESSNSLQCVGRKLSINTGTMGFCRTLFWDRTTCGQYTIYLPAVKHGNQTCPANERNHRSKGRIFQQDTLDHILMV